MDGQMTIDDGGPLLYYKLTLWAFGSGKLETQKDSSYRIMPIWK